MAQGDSWHDPEADGPDADPWRHRLQNRQRAPAARAAREEAQYATPPEGGTEDYDFTGAVGGDIEFGGELRRHRDFDYDKPPV